MTATAPNTYIIRRRGRLIVIFIAIVMMVAAAFSPAIFGLTMMALEEAHTGVAQNEGNSVWGVLPWLSMFTMVIFLPAAAVTAAVSFILIIRDVVVLGRERPEV
ncbi:MAG: hypothetical protein ACPGYK_08725 [Flavobacteriales bacterium]